MMNSDLDELKQLVAELRADHLAQKAKEKREGWTKYVSLPMVVIAVLAAIATMGVFRPKCHNRKSIQIGVAPPPGAPGGARPDHRQNQGQSCRI